MNYKIIYLQLETIYHERYKNWNKLIPLSASPSTPLTPQSDYAHMMEYPLTSPLSNYLHNTEDTELFLRTKYHAVSGVQTG